MNKYFKSKIYSKSLIRTFVWGGGADYAPINIITKFGKNIRIKIEDYDSKNTGVF